jgi:hypothetical protein
MRPLVFAALLTALLASAAWADIDPTRCICTLDQTQRLLMIPATAPVSPSATFTVTIRNSANNPVGDALVEILVGGIGQSRTKLCGAAVTAGHTNSSGVVTFNVPGGGCMKEANACAIRVNGIIIREYGVIVSPDYADTDNTGIPNRWDLCVSLADLPGFAVSFAAGGPSCHDFNNDGTTGLPDLAVFAAAYNKCCTR